MVSPKVIDSLSMAVQGTAYALAALLTVGFLVAMYALMGPMALVGFLGFAVIITILKIGLLWLL